jgi:hypothetical protein
MPCAIEAGLGLLKLKQEAPRLIILDEFGNLFVNNNNNNNSKSPSSSSLSSSGACGVIEVLCFIILILREKEAEREYGEDDDIVIRVI